jgi:hypothetical protein
MSAVEGIASVRQTNAFGETVIYDVNKHKCEYAY